MLRLGFETENLLKPHDLLHHRSECRIGTSVLQKSGNPQLLPSYASAACRLTRVPTPAEPSLCSDTVQYTRAILRRAINQAVQWDLVGRNVAALTTAPSSKRYSFQPFTPEQARTFLDAVRGDRLDALYSVAVTVGLRQGEALGLHWEDLDLGRGTITVRHQLQRINKQLTIVEPKTSRSRRTIGIPDVTIAALQKHRIRQLEERLVAGAQWREHGLVFTTTIGTPLDARNVVRQYKKLLKTAGLPELRFHDLRHTCAALLVDQGVHARVVMETLGHSPISLTMNTYSHVMPVLQRDAASRINDLLTGSN
jgi:integrase